MGGGGGVLNRCSIFLLFLMIVARENPQPSALLESGQVRRSKPSNGQKRNHIDHLASFSP